MNINRRGRKVERDFATATYPDFIKNVKMAAWQFGNIFLINTSQSLVSAILIFLTSKQTVTKRRFHCVRRIHARFYKSCLNHPVSRVEPICCPQTWRQRRGLSEIAGHLNWVAHCRFTSIGARELA